MICKEKIIKQLNVYKTNYHEENEHKDKVIQFMSQNDKCFERSLAKGHITSSCLLLNKKMDKVLLMHHKKLDKWLQFGGHCDGDANILNVAIKECQEESGILDITPVFDTIFDIDVHKIPANSKDPEHYHYDLRFILKTNHEETFRKNHESKDLKWFSIFDPNLPTKEQSVLRMISKWKTIFNQGLHEPVEKKQIFSFQQTLKVSRKIAAEYLKDKKNNNQIENIICTGHCLPTLVELFSAIKEIPDSKIFLPVPYSIEQSSLKKIQDLGVKTFVTQNLTEHLEALKNILEQNTKNSILIECGGYLPQIWNDLSDKAKSYIKGAVEDTERGLRNYETLTGKIPVIDVARSVSKSFEDHIVGDSVIYSVENLLRTIDIPLINLNTLVVGFGKIGFSAARALYGRRNPVSVFDIDEHKLLEAFNCGYNIDKKPNLLSNADVLIGCSGENSILIDDILHIKNGAILASGSSRQIEFKNLLENADSSKKVCENIYSYHYNYNNQTKTILVLNNGFPVNFLHGSSMGSRIDIVIASLISGALYLKSSDINKMEKNIKPLPFNMQKEMAKLWLESWDYGKSVCLPILDN